MLFGSLGYKSAQGEEAVKKYVKMLGRIISLKCSQAPGYLRAYIVNAKYYLATGA